MIMWYPSGMIEPEGWWDDSSPEEFERIRQWCIREIPRPPPPLYVWSVLVEEVLKYYRARAEPAAPPDSGSGGGGRPRMIITSIRLEELAASLFREMEHLDPTEEGNPDLKDWGWSLLDERRKQFYRYCIEHILDETGVEHE